MDNKRAAKFFLSREEVFLLVIDIQERLSQVMDEGKKVIAKTVMMLKAAKILNIPCLATEQYPTGLGGTVAEIAACLEASPIFEKTTFTAYTEAVAKALQESKRKKILIAGMEAHVCVLQTVRDLLIAGYDVFVIGDAICSRAGENYLNAICLMSEMGAVISNAETVLFDLLKESGSKEFKAISGLIK